MSLSSVSLEVTLHPHVYRAAKEVVEESLLSLALFYGIAFVSRSTYTDHFSVVSLIVSHVLPPHLQGRGRGSGREFVDCSMVLLYHLCLLGDI